VVGSTIVLLVYRTTPLSSSVNACWLKIHVEQVFKSILKPFPNGLYRYKTAEKQHCWLSRLTGKLCQAERGLVPQRKIKASFEALPEKCT